ncbi:MAG: hypothetical protein JO160_07800 [Candidatus Eremiobacteraeota bacterium]|nr:hypothetical protein [Candidatus Eremiobacteraeota bacterium]MBV8655936.1 hypothetical protein [Candidatus Eremiobacteraeota bacterium]
MNSADSSNAAAAGIVGVVFLVYFVILIAIVAFMIWVYWRIFTKAGYNGALALLNLVPGVGPLICVCILGFGRWPIEDALAAAQGHSPGPGYAPPLPVNPQ